MQDQVRVFRSLEIEVHRRKPIGGTHGFPTVFLLVYLRATSLYTYNMYRYIYTHTCVYTYTCVYYIHIHVYIYIYIYVFIHTHIQHKALAMGHHLVVLCGDVNLDWTGDVFFFGHFSWPDCGRVCLPIIYQYLVGIPACPHIFFEQPKIAVVSPP